MAEFFQNQLQATRVARRPEIRLAQSRIRMPESRFQRGPNSGGVLDRKFKPQLLRLLDARGFAGEFQEDRAWFQTRNQTLFLHRIRGVAFDRP